LSKATAFAARSEVMMAAVNFMVELRVDIIADCAWRSAI
jgi:hypothetical protein